MNKVDVYVNDLMRANGLPKAIRIAERCMSESNASNWSSLPVGPVFYTKPYGKDRWDLKRKELIRINGFWTQVFFLLKKKAKG